MTAEVSAQRLLRLTWSAIARLAGGFSPGSKDFAAILVDRLALLTPRLAMQDATGAGFGEGALRDLRLATHLIALKRAQSALAPPERARIDDLMDGLAAHYGGLARGAPRTSPDALLPALDATLSRLAGQTAPARRRAALGLVGLRRNLFPTAAPFVATSEQPA
jgi:hypothetical protein